MSPVGKSLSRRGSVIRQLLTFLWQNKLWWMIPILVIMLLLVVIIWFTQTAAIPYIYTLF